MRILIAILILTSISLRAQTCDSLKNEEVTYDVPIATLENLSESNCDKAKLYLAYELLHGYHIEKDTVRAIGLLIECKDHDIDCNYELFKLNYKSKPKIAYQLIRELALLDSMTCYWDSAMVINARLIAANMAEQNLGNQEGIVKSAVWYLLYYEIENAWMDWEESPTKNMIDELMRVMNLLTEEQLDSAYFEAEKLLGQKPIFKRKMIK